MEKFDWESAIKRNILMLKITGLWPEEKSYQPNLYTLYAIISIFIFVCAYNFFQSVNILFIMDDLQALAETAFIYLTQMLAILKSYYLIQNMKILKELMATLNSIMFQPKNRKQRNLVEVSINSWKMVYTVFSVMSLSAVIFLGVFPVVDTSTKERRLPLPAWYPYNYKISPLYEMTYVYQIISICFICIVNLNVDTLIAALNTCVGAQCDILCDDLKQIGKFLDVNRRLIGWVRHHQVTIQFAQDANKFFNWIVLVQFFTSAVSLAMTMFQLTVIKAFSSEFYSRIFYGNAILVQLFMYCWFGNEVEVKSGMIPSAAFQADWVGTSLKVQKNLIFLILKCQKPIRVSALNLFYLSLETFMTILRTSWSFFAVLRQVNG